jgi:hypothetical protein
MKPKRSNDEMHRGIDALASVVPSGQLMAVLGPLPFLGAAAEHIKELNAETAAFRAEVERLREALRGIAIQYRVDSDGWCENCGCKSTDFDCHNPLCPPNIARRALGEQPKDPTAKL